MADDLLLSPLEQAAFKQVSDAMDQLDERIRKYTADIAAFSAARDQLQSERDALAETLDSFTSVVMTAKAQDKTDHVTTVMKDDDGSLKIVIEDTLKQA